MPNHVIVDNRVCFKDPLVFSLIVHFMVCHAAILQPSQQSHLMEIVFKSPAQPEERLLHDALAENCLETLSALLSAICDTIFTTSFLPNKLILSSLRALEILEPRLRLELTNIDDFKWSFTLKERYIIQDASDGRYAEDKIEGAFYKHGGYNGIVALILYFRKCQNIEKHWAAIIEGFRGWFVKRVAEMLSRRIVEWIPKFLSARGSLGPHSLQYLGGHAGRKRKRHTLETEGASGAIQARPSSSRPKLRDTSATVPQHCQQSQEIHQNGQSVASPPRNHGAGNPHQRDQQSFQPHQDAPTPISNVPSPEQNFPQQQQYRNPSNISTGQDVTSIPHKHIPTPRSSVSSPSDNNTSSSVLDPSEDLINPLPVLIYSLGYSQLRQDILFRGLLLQKRWDDRGKVYEITPHNAGFNKQVTRLFSNRGKLEQTIDSCIRLGLVVQGVLEDGSLVYSISDQSRHQICQSFKDEELHLLGLMFTTHIYPRDQTLEPSFQDVGKLLLPYLERTWQFVLEEHCPTLPVHLRDSLVEASLATYKLVGTSRTKDLNLVLAKMQDPDLTDYLRMAIVTRKSILLRLKGDHDQSDVVIQDILESVAIDSEDIRSHCAYGRLLLSRTENAILRKEFDKAELYLTSWEVKNLRDPSGLELQVVRLKNTVHGRVSRYKGKFEHARFCLEACLETIPGDASRYHVMHHLGDVYCELERPEETETLVLNDIEQLRAHGKQRSKAFRRLALPLVEAYIQQGKLESAEALLGELLVIFDGLVNLDVPDQLGHVRLMIGLARVGWSKARWSEARQTLEKALVLTENYRTFSKRNFYKGVIYLFLSLANFGLHKYPEARLTLASANTILCGETPRHFIPGMGSYFLQKLLRIERLLQWPCNSVNEIRLSAAFRAQMT